jgi:hypothetical protein
MQINIIKNRSPHKKRRREFLLIYPFNKDLQNFNKVDDLEIVAAAKKGYHVVSVGYIGMTFFSTICQYGFGLNQNAQQALINPVLKNKETGTLFPRAKLTILPYQYRTQSFITINNISDKREFTYEEIKNHISDALNAEINLVKSGKVIFDFRDLGEDMYTYNSILHDIIINDFKEIEGDVYYYSFNNKEFVTEAEYANYSIFLTSFEKTNKHQRNKERQEIIQKEKAEKQKRKELKRILNEPNVIARELKIKSTRNYIQSVRNLHFSERLAVIAKSERVVYFYSELLDEILNSYNLKEHEELILMIISKFKENEVRQFKKLKKQLELAIQL